MPNVLSSSGAGYNRLLNHDLLDRDVHTDDDERAIGTKSILKGTTPQDFDEDDLLTGSSNFYGTNRNMKTGRQRKKIAARSKGGEFQTKRRKRRVYFCCISSEIDVTKLMDYLHGASDVLLYDWQCELHNDVLHLYKPGIEDVTSAMLPVGGKGGTDDLPGRERRDGPGETRLPYDGPQLAG